MVTRVQGEPSALAAALAKVQAELPPIAKGETARIEGKEGRVGYEYSYADLADVSAEVLPVLGSHGLAFTAWPTLDEGRFVLAYTLMHESGEERTGNYPLPASGTPQQIGAVITYARRYCLCAVTGVAPGGDDNDAAGAAEVRMDRPAQPPADPAVLAADQALREAKGLVWDVWKAQHDGVGDALMFKAAYEQFAQATPNVPGGSLEEAGPDELRSFRQHLVQTAAGKPEPVEEKAATDG
jgi:hypothetical protein